VRLIASATLLAAVVGCVAPDDSPPVARRSALGEPSNGFPSAAERLGIMAINRARSDPATVRGAQSAAYAARPPVIWSYELSRSARFHATNLRLSNVTLMHSSPCPLNTNVATTGCDGNPTCACATPVPTMCAACATVAAVNSCGTGTFARIAFFTAGTATAANGEVAAAGYADPMAVVDGWMFEAAGADGHRMNLTDQGIRSNAMGYGRAAGTGCFSSFDVSDSGNVTGAAIPKLPTAAVRGPANGAAGSYAFYATWADAAGAPASLNVVVDGACTAMARELGTDTLNATYKATLSLAAGCHNYFVVARDAAGASLTFPTTGAITIPVASATACASDFLATAPAAACAGDGGAPPPPVDAATDRSGTGSGGANGAAGSRGTGGGAGGTNGAAGGSGTAGASGAAGISGAAGAQGATGAGGNLTAADGGAKPPAASVSGGCGCAVTGTRSPPLLGGGLLTFGLLVMARRRRRPRR
jgi:MYXO-CTERM domain-containing protein